MGSSWKRQGVEEPSYHDDRSMGEHAFLAFTQSERNSLSKLDKFCQSTSIRYTRSSPQYTFAIPKHGVTSLSACGCFLTLYPAYVCPALLMVGVSKPMTHLQNQLT